MSMSLISLNVNEETIQNFQFASLCNRGNINIQGAHMRGHITREINSTSKMMKISIVMENAEVSLHVA